MFRNKLKESLTQERKLTLVGLKADLEKLDFLVRESLFKDEFLDGYWEEIVEDVLQLRKRLRISAEKEWEKTKLRDLGNHVLIQAVRKRDGDFCRFCGCQVEWVSRKSGRSGTYAHLIPGLEAKTADDLVVACRICAKQRDDDFKEGMELALPLPL